MLLDAHQPFFQKGLWSCYQNSPSELLTRFSYSFDCHLFDMLSSTEEELASKTKKGRCDSIADISKFAGKADLSGLRHVMHSSPKLRDCPNEIHAGMNLRVKSPRAHLFCIQHILKSEALSNHPSLSAEYQNSNLVYVPPVLTAEVRQSL